MNFCLKFKIHLFLNLWLNFPLKYICNIFSSRILMFSFQSLIINKQIWRICWNLESTLLGQKPWWIRILIHPYDLCTNWFYNFKNSNNIIKYPQLLLLWKDYNRKCLPHKNKRKALRYDQNQKVCLFFYEQRLGKNKTDRQKSCQSVFSKKLNVILSSDFCRITNNAWF